MGRATILFVAICSLCFGAFAEQGAEVPRHRRVIDDVLADHQGFYSGENLRNLTLGLAGAWVLASSEADEEVQDWYRESVKARASDDVSRLVKPLGNGRVVVPACMATLILGRLAGEAPGGSLLRQWSGRSLRALLLGAPPVLFLQAAVGASRPKEGGSRWHPFEDDNGVSGHSFVGAVPFLSAARMTPNRLSKSLFFAASTLCGLSRVNDDAHYLSQTAMGWWVAYLASGSVERTESRKRTIQILPVAPFDQGEVAVALIVTF